MKSGSNSCRRVLALYPSRRHFAFAVVEERGLLVDWALVRLYSNRAEEFLSRIDPLIDRYQPANLIMQAEINPRRAPRIRELLDAAAIHADVRGIGPIRVNTDDLKNAFGEARSSHARAEVVASFFPELRPLLPEKRRVATSDREAMAVFGAAGLVIAAGVSRDHPSTASET